MSDIEQERRLWLGMAKAVAHDMGTPLSSILGWLELLPTLSDPQEAMAEIKSSLDKLSLLSVRLEQLDATTKLKDVDLNETVENAVSFIRKRLSEETGIALQCNIPPNLKVRGRPELLEWALENLLANAVEALPDNKGTIKIVGCSDNGQAKIEITDDGRGIPPGDSDRVFDAGYSTRRNGRGIGLTLARYLIAEVHNGSLKIKPSHKGKGTTVEITINAVN